MGWRPWEPSDIAPELEEDHVVDTDKFLVPEKTDQERWTDWREAVGRNLDKLVRGQGPVVDEWAQESGSTSQLELPVAWGGPWNLEAVLVVLPSGTTGATLTIGDRAIPIVPSAGGGTVGGLTLIRGVTIPMAARDKIRVDYAPAAGGVYLEATGHGIVQEAKR